MYLQKYICLYIYNICHGCGLVGHLVASCPKQPYSPLAKFQYGDWLRAPLKKKQVFSAISKERIYFHEEGDSFNSQSDFSTIGDDSFLGTGPVTVPSGFGDAVPLRAASITAPRSPVHTAHLSGHAKAAPATTEEIAADAGINGADAAGLHGLSEVFVVDVSGHVHVSENALLGDEAGVFAANVSYAVAAPVTLASSFDAIEEWLADNGESEVPGEEALPIQLLAKCSSDGYDPSRVKRAKSVVSTLALKDTRNAKAGMNSSKNSLAVVDKQPHRGK
ncbi:hypothetical protein V6N11_082595 [Hibiscus sabdariffa]|uniref:CCHC-type domain-containing protein n=1 Tax=Hibiscus sabdariffa TaxID=183260 RepID=A0ABR2N935_9ROSI